MTDFRALLRVLAEGEAEYIVVGGLAAVSHGSSRLTQDLDIVYARTAENISRLVAVLRPHAPYLRGAPRGLPFELDAGTIQAGLNFTLETDLGDLDLLGEVTGGGGYDQLLPHSIEIEVFGIRCRVLGLAKLIEVKRAAGRPKDIEAISELETLREEREG